MIKGIRYTVSTVIAHPKLSRILASLLFIAVCNSTATSQIFTNSGATIHIQDGAIVQVNGSANNGSGSIDNDGTTYVTGSFTIGAAATTNGRGFMYVAGDWTSNGTFTANALTDSSTIVWNGTAQDYGGSSVSHFWNLTVTGGNVKTFAQDARLSGVLDLTNGTMLTTENDLFTFTPSGFWINGSTASHIDGPAAKEFTIDTEFTYPIGKVGRYQKAGVKPQTSDPVTYRAEYFFQSYPDVTSVVAPIVFVSIRHFWHIDKTSGTNDAQVRLYWILGDYAASWLGDPTDLLVARWNGAAWESAGADDLNPLSNYISGDLRSDLVSTWLAPNQPFTLASLSGDNPLPVELLSFNARQSGDKVILDWQTDAEIMNAGFEIERRFADHDPELIQTYRFNPELKAKSVWGAEYKTSDRPEELGQYTYDLYQLDRDGTRNHVATRTLNYETSSDNAALTVSVYPNPANTSSRIAFELISDAHITVLIYDVTGREVLRAFHGALQSGSHDLVLPIDELSSGVYSVVLSSASFRVAEPLVISR